MTQHLAGHRRTPRVVIVGGGFAGAYTARALLKVSPGHAPVRVELIDRENYFVFQPLLPEVAGGAVNALDCVTPLRELLPTATVRPGEVRAVDFQRKRVEVVQGDMGDVVHVSYDHLVLAPGLVTDLSRYPGMPEHAFTVKEALDSFALRDHVVACLEEAALTNDRQERERLLTFVVAGGGFSGIEVLGEIMELVHRSLRFYNGIGRGDVRFVLVEYGDRILPEVDEGLARRAADFLRSRGAALRLNTPLRSASAYAVEVADGTLIPTATIVATVGNAPGPLVERLPLPKEKGRIVVEPDLRVKGFRNVWALGDAAFVPLPSGGLAPPTAQAAVREARTCARNILHAVDGDPTEPFRYRSRGTLASLGGRKAVADIRGLHVTGTFAWVLWRLVYVSMVPKASTRWRVAIEQFLDLFLPRSIVRTGRPFSGATRTVRHRAGETALKPGQIGDGMHIILEGAYDQILPDGEGRILQPGDRFGGASAASGVAQDTLVRARADSLCFVMNREDVQRLVAAFQHARQPPREAAESRRLQG